MHLFRKFRQSTITFISGDTLEMSPGLMFVSSRRLIVFLLLGFMPTIAVAQNANTQPAESQNKPRKLEQYVHTVPRTPAEYSPITPKQRLGWFVRSTVGPKSLTGGLFSAGYGTAVNSPFEYGPHWEGFAKRYGMRLTGISTGNAMEVTLGAAWGEDPRYFHTDHQPFGTRVKNVIDLTFRAYGSDGERHPAYARYIAVVGNNFLSNTWRAQSEADWQHALERSAQGFGARALSNAFGEFVTFVWTRNHPHSTASPPGSTP